MHDAYRVDKGGAGTFDQVMRGWQVLRGHEVEFNILCTLHAANADHPLEVYHFFRDELQAEFIQFIPIVERATARDTCRWRIRVGASVPAATARCTPRRRAGHRALGEAGAVRALPDRDLRRVGAAGRGQGLRADFRRGPGELGGPAQPVHLLTDLRQRPGPGAQRRSVFVRPLRRAGLPAGQHPGNAHDRAGRIGPAAPVRPGQRDSLPRYCRECEVRFACHGGCPATASSTRRTASPG